MRVFPILTTDGSGLWGMENRYHRMIFILSRPINYRKIHYFCPQVRMTTCTPPFFTGRLSACGRKRHSRPPGQPCHVAHLPGKKPFAGKRQRGRHIILCSARLPASVFSPRRQGTDLSVFHRRMFRGVIRQLSPPVAQPLLARNDRAVGRLGH